MYSKEETIRRIRELVSGVEGEDILWSTKLGTVPSYCHTLNRYIHYTIHTLEIASGLEEPTDRPTDKDTPLRVYESWEKLVELLNATGLERMSLSKLGNILQSLRMVVGMIDVVCDNYSGPTWE